jgi:hypothetical protein
MGPPGDVKKNRRLRHGYETCFFTRRDIYNSDGNKAHILEVAVDPPKFEYLWESAWSKGRAWGHPAYPIHVRGTPIFVTIIFQEGAA